MGLLRASFGCGWFGECTDSAACSAVSFVQLLASRVHGEGFPVMGASFMDIAHRFLHSNRSRMFPGFCVLSGSQAMKSTGRKYSKHFQQREASLPIVRRCFSASPESLTSSTVLARNMRAGRFALCRRILPMPAREMLTKDSDSE